MKILVTCTIGIALALACGSASADKCCKKWDDLSWWAQSGATPAPVKDNTRSGYWWRPTTPPANAGPNTIWGNRGVVYGTYAPPAPERPKPPAPKPKPVVEKPKVTRTIPVLNDVLFDFDKAIVKPEGKKATDKVVDIMSKNKGDVVVVEGHTCDLGASDYNMALGQKRANSLKDYMTSKGIDAARIATISKGEDAPAVPNDGPENRKLNRRAVFKLTIKD